MTGTKLRVVHVLGTLSYAGLQRRVLKLIEALPEFSHVVVFQSETEGPLHAEYANVCEVRQCVYRPGRRLDFFRRLTKLLRQIQPDVVVAHLFGNHTLISWVSFVAGVPATYGVSANDPVHYEKSVWKPMLLAHAARPFCRGEIAVSHSVGQVLISRLRLPARRVHVIPNGFVVEEVGARAAAGRIAAQRVPGDAVRIFMAARFDPSKEHPTLLRAMRLLRREGRNVELHLAGVFHRESRRASIEKLVDELGIRDVVKFLGERNDVPELMGASDVVAHSTNSEGLSVAMLEAMAAGVPLVATDIPSCREVLEDGRCGLLVPLGDAEAMAEAIGRVLDDEPLRRGLVNAASERVRSQYHVKRMAADYAALLRSSLLTRPARPTAFPAR
jgi:glycosyltransferase involved in cell wall biosynthesis